MVKQISHKKICPACPESRREEHCDEGSLSKSDKITSAVAQGLQAWGLLSAASRMCSSTRR